MVETALHHRQGRMPLLDLDLREVLTEIKRRGRQEFEGRGNIDALDIDILKGALVNLRHRRRQDNVSDLGVVGKGIRENVRDPLRNRFGNVAPDELPRFRDIGRPIRHVFYKGNTAVFILKYPIACPPNECPLRSNLDCSKTKF